MIKSIFIVLCLIVTISCKSSSDWMESEGFKYQALRTMGHAQYQGASVTEALSVLSKIEGDNGEQWFEEWYKMAEYQLSLTKDSRSKLSKGHSLLRSSNYFRISEFFIPTNDSRRLETYIRSRESFEKALHYLDLNHEVWDIPYEDITLRSYYFPGNPDKPLILFSNGFDGTVEENYFFNGQAAISRGYPVILYEGPGQSMALRRYNMNMTYRWERPVKAILSWAINKDKSLENSKKILYGISMGGHLSAQAASRMHEIDGVVIHGGPVNMQKTVLEGLPKFAANMYFEGKKERLNSLVDRLDRFKILSYQDRWAFSQLKWVYGQSSMSSVLDHLKDYNLEHINFNIPVLVMNGEDDLYEGIDSKNSFSNATIFTFPTESGAGSHCQGGAVEQSGITLFNWLEDNY